MTQAANLAALGSNTNTTGILPAAGGGTAGTAGVTGFKNRLINGAMVISQRAGTTATNITFNTQYVLDRWAGQIGISGVYSLQQVSDAPTGFTYSMQMKVVSGGAASGSQQYAFSQNLEGYNIADLGWGTASAKTCTLSFWAKSNLTGTFSGAVLSADQTRSYVFTYSLPTANTWTYVTTTITGPTTGTFGNVNNSGFSIWWCVGAGSTILTATTNSWTSGYYIGANGTTQLTATTNNTLNITGVQFEVGTAATDFDTRSYGTELGLCERYYQTYGNVSYTGICSATMPNNGAIKASIIFPVPMRTLPSATFSNLIFTDRTAFDIALTTINQFHPSNNSVFIGFSLASTVGGAGYAGQVAVANGTTGNLNFIAEL